MVAINEYFNMESQTQNEVIEEHVNLIFDIGIADWTFDCLGTNGEYGEYNAVTIADITKKIIETTLKVSTEYLEELNRIR